MKWTEKFFWPIAIALVLWITAAGGQAAIHAMASSETPEGIPLPILMYHHVLKEDARLNKYTISPQELRRDLQYLKDNGYTAITVRDLIDYCGQGTPLPEKPVMITFDDGYESFYEYVFPMLEEFQCKAVFSIVGTYADQYTQTTDHHIRYSHATWDELKIMQESGLVEIQNHSYNLHSNDKGRQGAKRKPGENLAAYNEMLAQDLNKVQDACLENLGIRPTAFTYPFGHISAEALPVIKSLGFQAALTCQEKWNYITGDPEQLFHLNRYNRPHDLSAQAILEKGR